MPRKILLFLLQLKCARNVEAEENISTSNASTSVASTIGTGLGYEGSLKCTTCVGHHQLEDVTACLDIDPKTDGVVRFVVDSVGFWINPVVIFTCEGDALAYLYSSAHSQCHLIISVGDLIN